MEVTFKNYLGIVASSYTCAHMGQMVVPYLTAVNLKILLEMEKQVSSSFPIPSEVPKTWFCLNFEYFNRMLYNPSPWIIASIYHKKEPEGE